jgi:hypothetical protein
MVGIRWYCKMNGEVNEESSQLLICILAISTCLAMMLIFSC